METTKLVSILVPIYNVEKYIHRCLTSILTQEKVDVSLTEYIFVDDCGTDNSMNIVHEICSEYIDKGYDIKIFRNKHNLGLASTRNVAVSHARGKYVLHVDSDDYLEARSLSLLIDIVKHNNDIDIVLGNVAYDFGSHKDICYDLFYKDKNKYLESILLRKSMVNIWGKLIKRCLYEDNNIRCIDGVNQGEDYCVYPRLVYCAKNIVKVDAVLYNYIQVNQNSYSRNSSNQKSINQIYTSQKLLSDYFADKLSDTLLSASSMKSLLLLLCTSKSTDYPLLKELFPNLNCCNPYLDFKHSFVLLLFKLRFYKMIRVLISVMYNRRIS